MLNKLSIFYYATTLDLIMGYYNIFLANTAKKVRTVTTLFGKQELNFLPMGVCISPDIFQEKLSALIGT